MDLMSLSACPSTLTGSGVAGVLDSSLALLLRPCPSGKDPRADLWQVGGIICLSPVSSSSLQQTIHTQIKCLSDISTPGGSYCPLSLPQGEAGYWCTSTLTLPKHLRSQNVNCVCRCPHKHDTCNVAVIHGPHHRDSTALQQSSCFGWQFCLFGGGGEVRRREFEVFDESGCRPTFMPPRPDGTGLAPSRRSAGV